MSDKERLKQAILQDMKHWSADTLAVALHYIDDHVLSFVSDDFLWWWDLRKKVAMEIEKRKVHNVFAGEKI